MLTSEGIIFLIFIAVLSGLTGYSFHRRDAVKKLLALMLVLMSVFTGAMAESVLPADGREAGLSSGKGIIFVATDRHAAYETVKASGEGTGEVEKSPEEGPPPEGEKPPEGKKPRRENRMPAYDENGNMIWHNHTMESGKDGREIERAHYLRLPGEPLTVQTWETDGEGKETGTRIRTTEAGEEIREPVTRTAPLRFVYLNAGYITNGGGTVLSFRDGKMNVKRYFLDEEEKAEPWTYDLRFPPQGR